MNKTKDLKRTIQKGFTHPIKLVHRDKGERASGVLNITTDVKRTTPNCFTPYKARLVVCL